jgi:hypothetical protein
LADKRLVLWDIDHTLIDTGGFSREIYQEAFEQVTGQPMQRQADISGRTEPDIFRDTVTSLVSVCVGLIELVPLFGVPRPRERGVGSGVVGLCHLAVV